MDSMEMAFHYLAKSGHKILMRDYECALGNIDLVSKHNRELVFTEVLTEDEKSAGKMEKVASYYLKRYGIRDVIARFQVVRVRVSITTEVING